MTSVFVGVIVVAIIGNAAEHSTAILVARKNRMDLALGIAIGSSIQVALFVAPVLVFASYWIGPAPMDLVFSPAEVIAIVIAVAITGQIASDGESQLARRGAAPRGLSDPGADLLLAAGGPRVVRRHEPAGRGRDDAMSAGALAPSGALSATGRGPAAPRR